MIDRRTALAGVAAMFTAPLFAPIARAAGQAAFTPAVAPEISEGAPSIAVFTAEQRALVTALSERVIPTTDTPGAIAAEVPAYIEKLLADWAMPEDRKPIIAGLTAIDARSRQDYKVPAAKAKPAQQDALLTLAMEDKFPGGEKFFEMFRQMVVTGYYTSEIGITQEREYLPVPGEYNGAIP
jgi:gluconate 2-dehydrogenase gamma chain